MDLLLQQTHLCSTDGSTLTTDTSVLNRWICSYNRHICAQQMDLLLQQTHLCSTDGSALTTDTSVLHRWICSYNRHICAPLSRTSKGQAMCVDLRSDHWVDHKLKSRLCNPRTFALAWEIGKRQFLYTSWGIVHLNGTGQNSNDECQAFFLLPSVTMCQHCLHCVVAGLVSLACEAVFPSLHVPCAFLCSMHFSVCSMCFSVFHVLFCVFHVLFCVFRVLFCVFRVLFCVPCAFLCVPCVFCVFHVLFGVPCAFLWVPCAFLCVPCAFLCVPCAFLCSMHFSVCSTCFSVCFMCFSVCSMCFSVCSMCFSVCSMCFSTQSAECAWLATVVDTQHEYICCTCPPHRDGSCRSNFQSHPVTVDWHWANQSQHWPYIIIIILFL